MEQFFGDRKITLYASGTAALARAIANCAARRSVSTPEIIIPAYGCPDLVAACVHASVYPRLVDVAPLRWSYDLSGLEASLSVNTVGIVAVNLLGLGDSSADLIRVCRERNLLLIQDSAQHLPRETMDWLGDYIVLSFGRGKPLNLLHGGALIAPPGSNDILSDRPERYTGKDRLLASPAAAIAFNVLTRPHLYGVLSALPRTGLGEVVYKPLLNPSPTSENAWRRVGTAFQLYRCRASYRRDIWAALIEEWSHLGIVALDSPGSPPQPEPLRLALLAPDRLARDLLVDGLNQMGLGASRLYGTELPGIAGIPAAVACQGPFPNAQTLAGRLFTLPTHHLVTKRAVKSAHTVVMDWYRSTRATRS